jgi:ABC-type Na+ efflux pump permease subunit
MRSINRLAQGAARGAALAFGVWLAALLPVEIWVEARRAANAARGYLPGMDPGVVAVVAMFVAVPLLGALFLIELARCSRKASAPLAYLSCVLLGVMAAWPVGLAFSFPELSLGKGGVMALSALGIAAFYGARRARLAARAKGMGDERG